jgi:hypothetical protein
MEMTTKAFPSVAPFIRFSKSKAEAISSETTVAADLILAQTKAELCSWGGETEAAAIKMRHFRDWPRK